MSCAADGDVATAANLLKLERRTPEGADPGGDRTPAEIRAAADAEAETSGGALLLVQVHELPGKPGSLQRTRQMLTGRIDISAIVEVVE